jgi:hypothetical protein
MASPSDLLSSLWPFRRASGELLVLLDLSVLPLSSGNAAALCAYIRRRQSSSPPLLRRPFPSGAATFRFPSTFSFQRAHARVCAMPGAPASSPAGRFDLGSNPVAHVEADVPPGPPASGMGSLGLSGKKKAKPFLFILFFC